VSRLPEGLISGTSQSMSGRREAAGGQARPGHASQPAEGGCRLQGCAAHGARGRGELAGCVCAGGGPQRLPLLAALLAGGEAGRQTGVTPEGA
jgi:hypothetical protein